MIEHSSLAIAADRPTPLERHLARSEPAIWLSGKEAAEHVGVSWPTLRQTLLARRIPHVRLGRRWKIELAVLDAHLRRMADPSMD